MSVIAIRKVRTVGWAKDECRPKGATYFTCMQTRQIHMHLQAVLFEPIGKGGIVDAVAVDVSDQESKIVMAI